MIVPNPYFDWIQKETDQVNNTSSDWKGNVVTHCIPKRYQYFCKIFHRMYQDKNISNEQLLWRDCDPNEEFVLGNLITYKELAEKYRLNYTKEFSTNSISMLFNRSLPRYLISPEEGDMEIDMVKEIVKNLNPFSQGKRCYFYYPFLKKRHWDGEDQIFQGALEEVLVLSTKEDPLGSPTYWWPEDKSWCLCTDFDLDFTLFGGTKEMVESILNNPLLEAIWVDSNTRIDYRADEGNVPN